MDVVVFALAYAISFSEICVALRHRELNLDSAKDKVRLMQSHCQCMLRSHWIIWCLTSPGECLWIIYAGRKVYIYIQYIDMIGFVLGIIHLWLFQTSGRCLLIYQL